MKKNLILAFLTLSMAVSANCGSSKSSDDNELIVLALLSQANRGGGNLDGLSPEELVARLNDITSPTGQANLTSTAVSSAASSATTSIGTSNSQRGMEEDMQKYLKDGMDPYMISDEYSKNSATTKNTTSGTINGTVNGREITISNIIYRHNGVECARASSSSTGGNQGTAVYSDGTFSRTTEGTKTTTNTDSNIVFTNFGTIISEPIILLSFYKALKDNNFFNRCNRVVSNDFSGPDCNCDLVKKVYGLTDKLFQKGTINGSIKVVSKQSLSQKYGTSGSSTTNADGSTTAKFNSLIESETTSNSDQINIKVGDIESGNLKLENLRHVLNGRIDQEVTSRQANGGTDYSGFSISGFMRLNITGSVNGTALNDSLGITF